MVQRHHGVDGTHERLWRGPGSCAYVHARGQAGGDRALVAEARGHLERARRTLTKLGEDVALTGRLNCAAAAVAAVEAWATACEECEAAVRRGKEALASGNRDEAAEHCQAARGLLDRGLKSEMLRGAVRELEDRLRSAADMDAARRAGGESLAAAQAALLVGNTSMARTQHTAAAEHFARAGAVEMLAALDALAAHIASAEERAAADEARRRGDELLEEAGALIKAGELVRARAAVDAARRAYDAAGVEGVGAGLDRIEQQVGHRRADDFEFAEWICSGTVQ